MRPDPALRTLWTYAASETRVGGTDIATWFTSATDARNIAALLVASWQVANCGLEPQAKARSTL
jgi:hypothetical protein